MSNFQLQTNNQVENLKNILTAENVANIEQVIEDIEDDGGVYIDFPFGNISYNSDIITYVNRADVATICKMWQFKNNQNILIYSSESYGVDDFADYLLNFSLIGGYDVETNIEVNEFTSTTINIGSWGIFADNIRKSIKLINIDSQTIINGIYAVKDGVKYLLFTSQNTECAMRLAHFSVQGQECSSEIFITIKNGGNYINFTIRNKGLTEIMRKMPLYKFLLSDEVMAV